MARGFWEQPIVYILPFGREMLQKSRKFYKKIHYGAVKMWNKKEANGLPAETLTFQAISMNFYYRGHILHKFYVRHMKMPVELRFCSFQQHNHVVAFPFSLLSFCFPSRTLPKCKLL